MGARSPGGPSEGRPVPTPLLHFTRIEHLPAIASQGLLSDQRARAEGLLAVEVGNARIKARRSERTVPVHPGGVVSDYVPFYFAPRSPMMFAIDRGNVATYREGCHRLVYLVAHLEGLQGLNIPCVLTDRNAVLRIAEFWPVGTGEPPEGFIDWDLMRQRAWFSTNDYPDRRERRMAECLAHGRVPFEAFEALVAMSPEVAEEAEVSLLRSGSLLPVRVDRDWFF